MGNKVDDAHKGLPQKRSNCNHDEDMRTGWRKRTTKTRRNIVVTNGAQPWRERKGPDSGTAVSWGWVLTNDGCNGCTYGAVEAMTQHSWSVRSEKADAKV